MGYTHYFTCKKSVPLESMPKIIESVSALFVEAIKTIKIGNYNGEMHLKTPEQIFFFEADGKTLFAIKFNGLGPYDHETFSLHMAPDDYEFCKTNRKPYDTLVTAVLIAVYNIEPECWDISSDGDREEWAAGLALARKVLGENLSYPEGVCISFE